MCQAASMGGSSLFSVIPGMKIAPENWSSTGGLLSLPGKDHLL